MNSVAIVGRQGADCELKYTNTGVAVTNIRVAVRRQFKNPSGEYESDWFDVVLWKGDAEFCANYLGKGRLVGVAGRLQTRSYQTQSGEKRTVTEIVANNIEGLDKAPEGQQQQATTTAESNGDDPWAGQ